MYIALDMNKLDRRRVQIEVEVTDLRRTVDAVARRIVKVRRDGLNLENLGNHGTHGREA